LIGFSFKYRVKFRIENGSICRVVVVNRLASKQTVSYPVDCSVPQGSVLGPLGLSPTLRTLLMSSSGTVFYHTHIYADDTQLLASAKPEDSSRLRQQLSDCAADVTQWCSSRPLQLNADKTEVLYRMCLFLEVLLDVLVPTMEEVYDFASVCLSVCL